MSFEEDTYDTIFKAMQHPIRRRILRMIGEKPATYTEIQRELNIDNGLLNYHLDALSSLITKNKEDKYTLSDFGKATTGLIKGVEDPSKATIAASMPAFVKWLSIILAVALLVSGLGLIELNNRYVELSGQNRQLNMEGLSLKFQLQTAKDEAERLRAGQGSLDLLSTSNSLRKLYTIDYDTITHSRIDATSIIFYVFDDNSTLHITLRMSDDPRLVLPLTIQKGDATNPDTATETVAGRPDLRYAPVYWSHNITYAISDAGRVDRSIVINESGWYTLNLNGFRFLGHPASVPGELWENETATYIPLNVHLEMSLSTEDNLFNIFVVREFMP